MRYLSLSTLQFISYAFPSDIKNNILQSGLDSSEREQSFHEKQCTPYARKKKNILDIRNCDRAYENYYSQGNYSSNKYHHNVG